MTDKQICKYHKFDKDNWEHLCTELEVVCIGTKKQQGKCYLVQRDKYKQALDEIEKMMKTCINQDICTLCLYSDSCRNPDDFCSYDPEKVILNIINKAKDGE